MQVRPPTQLALSCDDADGSPPKTTRERISLPSHGETDTVLLARPGDEVGFGKNSRHSHKGTPGGHATADYHSRPWFEMEPVAVC